MTMEATSPAAPNLESLYSAIDALGMEGGWHRKTPSLWTEPRQSFLPARWRYRDVKPILETAGTLVDHRMADRRNLTLTNPVPGNAYGTVRTLVAAYQSIRPGEKAEAHRHTPNALRIILEGTGSCTVVDGTRVPMMPGDVLLTPGWSWHSHESLGPDDCYWVDVLDVPLVQLLEPMFFERHPDRFEREVVDAVTAPIAFRRSDWASALARATAPGNGSAEREIELGSPALATIAVHVQALGAGFASAPMRTTANAVFTVLEGEGMTTAGGCELRWERGDVLAVPAWRQYQHVATSDAVLVRVSDEPVMRAFDFLRRLT
jgi:gentisate 1,2-dioxygenase